MTAPPFRPVLDGTYEVLSKLSEGGMGAIYKVRHRHLDEVRVVKVMKPNLLGNQEMAQRFTQEAQIVTKLKHANIAAIYDYVLDESGLAYIVMEYVNGANLAQLLEVERPLDLALALEVTAQTLSALAYLHRRKIVHRDISTHNVMLTVDEDGALVVKIIDLGLAKRLESQTGMTATGVIMGNLSYASPEQLGGLPENETLDGRSDLYSLGVVMYELLTGSKPFSDEGVRALISAHLFKPPTPFDLVDFDRKVPADVRAVVEKCLEKKPSARFASAEELLTAVSALKMRYGEPSSAEALRTVLAAARPKSSPSLPAVGVKELYAMPRSGSQDAALDDSAATRVSSEPSPRPPRPSEPTELSPPKPPLSAPSVSFLRRTPVLAGLGVVVVVSAAWALSRIASSRPETIEPAALPAASRPATAEPAAPAPTEAPTTPAEAPTPIPVAVATSVPGLDPAEAERRARTGEARTLADYARRRAESADSAALAPALFSQARAKEKEGEMFLASGRGPAAQAAFARATELYSAAEAAARQESTARARPTPERVVQLVVATAPPVARPTEAPPTRAPVAERAKPTEEERVREAVARYATAQSELDVDAYVRVRPALAADRKRLEEAFRNLKSQSVVVDVSRVEVDGDAAVVHGTEQRTYLPKVGSEGNVRRAFVMQLQKTPGGWVIASIR